MLIVAAKPGLFGIARGAADPPSRTCPVIILGAHASAAADRRAERCVFAIANFSPWEHCGRAPQMTTRGACAPGSARWCGRVKGHSSANER
jgi:hypothetical protein